MWRARFGRGFGPVVRHTTKWIKIWEISSVSLSTLYILVVTIRTVTCNASSEFKHTMQVTIQLFSLYAPWNPRGEVEIKLHSFLTSALGRGEWSTSRSGRLTPGGRYSLKMRLCGPQNRSGCFENCPCRESIPGSSSPKRNHCTHYAILRDFRLPPRCRWHPRSSRIPCWRFGTFYRPHLQVSRSPRLLDTCWILLDHWKRRGRQVSRNVGTELPLYAALCPTNTLSWFW